MLRFLFPPSSQKALFLCRCCLILIISASLIGSASALFLWLLHIVTDLRSAQQWLFYLLPLAGLSIGLMYYYSNGGIEKGNNLLLESYYSPQRRLPWLMAPLILISTLLTHLFGGSAGREGTAVQMGGTIAYQFQRYLGGNKYTTRVLILIGMSAGFSSLFGTPWAAAIFAIEVVKIGRIRWVAFIACFISSFIAHYICLLWQTQHTIYPQIPVDKLLQPSYIFWTCIVGIIFGWTSLLFIYTTKYIAKKVKVISFAPYRPFVGGFILLLLFFIPGSKQFAGLGIETIQASFQQPALVYIFAGKLFFTALTLGTGFRGGEVTPLFFVGATLGSALSLWMPLPVELLAGLGFVAVFAGATKTPFTSAIMGIELFGPLPAFYFILVCLLARISSGSQTVYSAQRKRKKQIIDSNMLRF